MPKPLTGGGPGTKPPSVVDPDPCLREGLPHRGEKMRGGILIFEDSGFRQVLLGIMAVNLVLEIVYFVMYLLSDAEFWEWIVLTLGSDMLLILCAYLYGAFGSISPSLMKREMTCRYDSSDGIANVFEESDGRE